MPIYVPDVEYDMDLYSRSDVDFRIQVSVPQAGIFTLGQSLLNGSDVLGSAFQWDVYEDELVEISYTRSVDVTSGIFTRPTAAIADVLVRASALNPNLNADIHPNTKIKIDRKTVDDVDWVNLITGFISGVSVQYFYDAQPVISIGIEDAMNRLLNAPISYTRAAGTLSSTMDDFMPLAIAAANLDDTVYTFTWNTLPAAYTSYKSSHGALAYTNVTVGTILNDLMDAELGNVTLTETTFSPRGRDANNSTYWVGNTTDFDNFEIGYNIDYLFSDIIASLTSAPSVQYTKTNTDVSSFFGTIRQQVSVNLQDAAQLDQWMTSVIQRSPALRVLNFSIPKFVPGSVVKITNDVAGETTPIVQEAVDLTITVDPTSISTSMRLYQPV